VFVIMCEMMCEIRSDVCDVHAMNQLYQVCEMKENDVNKASSLSIQLYHC
jgi:hypothetical protein